MATGLIDVGIIKPELAGSFAAGYRGAEQARQKAGLVQQETEMNQMKLEQLKQDAVALKQFQQRMRQVGQSDDPKMFFQEMIRSGRPEYMEKGYEGLRRHEELLRNEKLLRQHAPELFDAEPTNAMAPAAPAGVPAFGMPAGAQPSGDYTSTQAMGRVPGVVTTPIPESPPMNAMAPAAAPAAGGDVNALRRQIMVLSAIDDPRAKAMVDVLKSQITEASKPYVVAGRLVTGAGKELYAAPDKPAAPPAMVAEYTFAKTPEGGNFRGSFQDFVTARAAASRAPAQPVAPTLDTVVDPKNPNQMLRVDVRRYTPGTSVGSPGVIGISGKEPGAAVRENKAEAGKTQLADDLDNLRSSFAELDRMRAIPSTERGVVSNLMSAAQATPVGQALGRAGGTREQVERDVITSARQRLISSIKNATGMSSKSLDSNVELQTMLRSISDPGQSYEAAIRIIDDIENAYVRGAGMPKKNAPGAGAKPAPAATSSGATVSNW